MDRQQELVLLGFDAMLFSGGFAEVEESADLPSELGEVLILLKIQVGIFRHIYIVTRHILPACKLLLEGLTEYFRNYCAE